jgi:hypothetical protein
MPSVRKKSGPIAFRCDVESPSFCAEKPSTVTLVLLLEPPMAATRDADTSVTPGNAASRSLKRSKNCTVRSSLYRLSFGLTDNVTRWSGRMPSSTRVRLIRVCPNNTAAISSRSEIAICIVTSERRKKPVALVEVLWPL